MTMDLQQQTNEKVIFCPVSCLYSLSVSSEENDNMLDGCFSCIQRRGWAWLDRVQSQKCHSHHMFRPMTNYSHIIHSKKQMIRVSLNQEDVSTFEGILEKSVLMRVTRRQHCGTSVNVSPPDTENYRKYIDFAIIFPPAVSKQILKDTLEFIRLQLNRKQKFCLTFDLIPNSIFNSRFPDYNLSFLLWVKNPRQRTR